MQPTDYDPVILNIMPTGDEVELALEFAGFILPEARRVVDKGFKSLYLVRLPGYAEVSPALLRTRIACAFCEEAIVKSIRTQDNDVQLLLKLVAFPCLEPEQ